MSETAPPRLKPDLPKRRAWLRLEGETSNNFELFAAYRDMPSDRRTVERVWQAGDKSLALGTLRDLCADFHWVQRAVAFDDFVHEQNERAERFERVASLRKMRKKHREHGDALMSKAMTFLRNPKFEATTLADALRMVKTALELQTSGHFFDPTLAIVSGDNTEQPTEQTENRRLSIEVFTTGGVSMPADDLRSQLAAMYDQRPPGLAAHMSNPLENPSPPATDFEDGNQDEDLQPEVDE